MNDREYSNALLLVEGLTIVAGAMFLLGGLVTGNARVIPGAAVMIALGVVCVLATLAGRSM